MNNTTNQILRKSQEWENFKDEIKHEIPEVAKVDKTKECTCDTLFNQMKGWKLTMKGMKSVAIKWFIPHSHNKWECRRCGKEHVKNW